MKKIKYLLLITFLSIFTITNVYAKDTDLVCEYKSTDNQYQVTVTGTKTFFVFDSVKSSNIIYGGESITRGTVKNWKKYDTCYKYLGIYKKPNYGIDTEVTYSYEFYAANDINDLKGSTTNYKIIGLDGADISDVAPIDSKQIYYTGASGTQYGNTRYTSKVPEDVWFYFNTYKSGKREFCVLVNGNTKCDYLNGSDAPTISISGKKKDYKFSIDSGSTDYFFGDFSSDAWHFNANGEVYTLIGEKLNSSSSAKVLCGDNNENCNISLATFCTDAKVSRILKGVGILINIAKILVPTIIILMGFVNLFKIITAGKEDEARKYARSIVTKIIIGVIIFLLPGIINFFFDIANNIIAAKNDYSSEFTNCEKCILDVKNCDTSGGN